MKWCSQGLITILTFSEALGGGGGGGGGDDGI